MGIASRALRLLFPRGLPWTLSGDTGRLVDALAASLQRARDYVRESVDESIPSRAVDTLPEWYAALGLPYDPTLPLATRQAQARQAYVSAGGQSLASLDAVIQIAFPDVSIDMVDEWVDSSLMAGGGVAGVMQASAYPSWLPVVPEDGAYPVHYYRIVGEVDVVQDLSRLLGLLERIGPAEMEPVLAVSIRSTTGTAQAALGMAGLMEAGRTV